MLGEMGRERNRMRQELRAVAPLPDAWIGSFRQPGGTTRLARGGDPAREGPEVAPASLRALAPLGPGYALEAGAPEAERRLELARWIARPGKRPLRPGDGQPPVALPLRNRNRRHPQRLRRGEAPCPAIPGCSTGWPGQLVRHGFRLKPIHRIILGSHAWRQDSRPDAAMQALDQSARFLWRYPPRRLEAEAIRDAILLVSGSLDTRMGGPGFRLYRYTVDNVATYIPLDEHGPETFRRRGLPPACAGGRGGFPQRLRLPRPGPAGPPAATRPPLPSRRCRSRTTASSRTSPAAGRSGSSPIGRQVRGSGPPGLPLGLRAGALRTGAGGEPRLWSGTTAWPCSAGALLNANEFIHVR